MAWVTSGRTKLQWAVETVAKAGTLSIIGVYPAGFDSFPMGAAMNENMRINMGNCQHLVASHEHLSIQDVLPVTLLKMSDRYGSY